LGYISSICPQARCGQISTKFGIVVGVVNVITCEIFFDNWLRDADSVGIENQQSPLTKPVAVNSLLSLPCS